MILRPVLADRLAPPLAELERSYDRRAEQEYERQRRDRRPGGAESDVAKDIKDGEFAGELAEVGKHQAASSSAAADGLDPKRLCKASTSGPMRLAFDPLTITTSP